MQPPTALGSALENRDFWKAEYETDTLQGCAVFVFRWGIKNLRAETSIVRYRGFAGG